MSTVTVLYNNHQQTLVDCQVVNNDLWVQQQDLEFTSGFTLKPQGACLEDICIPLNRSDQDLFQGDLINADGFARVINQARVRSVEQQTWSYGASNYSRQAFHQDAQAPDFCLTDRQGQEIRLSQYKDKKVILMTWASW